MGDKSPVDVHQMLSPFWKRKGGVAREAAGRHGVDVSRESVVVIAKAARHEECRENFTEEVGLSAPAHEIRNGMVHKRRKG